MQPLQQLILCGIGLASTSPGVLLLPEVRARGAADITNFEARWAGHQRACRENKRQTRRIWTYVGTQIPAHRGGHRVRRPREPAGDGPDPALRQPRNPQIARSLYLQGIDHDRTSCACLWGADCAWQGS